MDGDQESLGVEAVHFDEAVLARRCAIDDDEDEVVVLVELRSLGELFGVFDREWMKLEDVSQDLKVIVCRLVEIEPEEIAGREQPFGRVAVEADLVVVLCPDDVTHRGAGFFGPGAAWPSRDRGHRTRLPARKICASTTASLCSLSRAP
jgi:hypothetical protein